MTENIKLSNDNTVAVNMDLHWIPVAEHKPPLGVKLLLIDEHLGVIVVGDYQSRFGYTHWQALPKFKRKAK